MSNNMNVVLEGLNEGQREAVQCIEGPELIIAGAGSGKTRVLTTRVAYIISSGVDPARILAVTFTKKAAGEMKERISAIVGPRAARKVVMGTFHAIFVRFLRQYHDRLGYPEAFTIYDTSDSISAIKACLKELQLDDKIYKPKDMLSRISMAKNNLVLVSSYRQNHELKVSDEHSKRPRFIEVYALYQQKLKAAGVMDFDDILVNMNILLRDFPDALQEISDRFSYIMVDEYQDTNYAQYLILKKMAATHRNISVVGDDSQSIYAFRGAKIENFLNFKKEYPDCRMFRLERNYRSTQTIVDAANSLIAHNEGRLPKKCYSEGEKGEPINLIKTWSEGEEAVVVVSEIIKRMRIDGAQYSDFAILYRTNSQSRALEEQLRRRNIPYMIYSGNSFFERAEVKDFMAYFKLCVNPNDDESFKRVVNKPARGIGDTTLSALNECARSHQCSLFKAAFQPDVENFGVRSAALRKILEFCRLIDSLAAAVSVTDAFDLARRIADESGLYAAYKADLSIEGQARVGNIDELVNSVQAFIEDRRNEADEADGDMLVTLDDFLENVSLLSNVDVKEDEDTNNKVALMTVHSAKGLEFQYVFVTGLEENLFPSMTMVSSLKDIEEERRLFYVAMTRARKLLVLTFATDRLRNGKRESNSVSRFVREIAPEFLDHPLSVEDDDPVEEPRFFGSGFGRGNRAAMYGSSGPAHSAARPSQNARRFHTSPQQPLRQPLQPQRAAKPDVIDPDFKAVPMSQLFVGERIEHNRFGAGTIKNISGVEPEMKAVITFDDYGEKLLLLKYAKLRPEKK